MTEDQQDQPEAAPIEKTKDAPAPPAEWLAAALCGVMLPARDVLYTAPVPSANAATPTPAAADVSSALESSALSLALSVANPGVPSLTRPLPPGLTPPAPGNPRTSAGSRPRFTGGNSAAAAAKLSVTASSSSPASVAPELLRVLQPQPATSPAIPAQEPGAASAPAPLQTPEPAAIATAAAIPAVDPDSVSPKSLETAEPAPRSVQGESPVTPSAPAEATSALPAGVARVVVAGTESSKRPGPMKGQAEAAAAPALEQSLTAEVPSASAKPALGERAFKPAGNEVRSEVSRSLDTQPPPSFQDASPPAATPEEASVPKATPVARLFQDIIHEAATIRRFQGDSVNVVLKPDAHTEISLHLTLKNGELEATARCERGDFNQLNLHWPELRQSLQQQGIRLHELTNSGRDGTGFDTQAGSSGFAEQNPRQFARPEEARAEFAPAPAPAARPARAVPMTPAPNRLFDSWA